MIFTAAIIWSMRRRTLTDEQLAEIRARLEAATPGPWHVAHTDGAVGKAEVTGEDRAGNPIWEQIHIADTGPVDVDFIAHAPTDIAALLAEVEALNREISDLEESRDYPDRHRK